FPDGEMQWRCGAAFRGPNSVFLIGDLAVKVFARRSPIWFQREVETLRVLGDVPEAKTPRLLAHGDAVSEEDPDHPYIIMERRPREPYWACRDRLSVEEECVLASQVAEMVRAMHEAPVQGLESFGRSPGEWGRRIRARAGVWAERVAPGWPPHLAAQV